MLIKIALDGAKASLFANVKLSKNRISPEQEQSRQKG
jgi:hypothetical protein